MTTAIDTNVIIALWDASDSLHRAARAALDKAFNEGTLVISGAVYAELVAGPGRTEAFVDRFCEETGIAVEWEFEEKMWRTAGTAFQGYAARRRKQNGAEARRILADFVIGAHALVNGYKLLTLDAGIYQASFPRLGIVELG
jgi:predicted nucleic acid-binding protein